MVITPENFMMIQREEHCEQERQGRLQVKLSCLSEHVRSECASLSVTKVHFSKCNNFKAVGIG